MTTYVQARERGAARTFEFNRIHRLLLYGAAAMWFVAYVLAHQRNYQDSWTLEGVVPGVIGLIVVYVLAIAREKDNRVVALLSAVTTGLLAMIPALKYVQPYGVSIDSTVHYLATQTITLTGHGLDPEQVYASIPAMHSWLASIALTGGVSPAVAIKYGLPMMSALYPLVIYWFSRGARVPANITKFTLALACMTAFPDYVPSGSGFSLLPFLLLLGSLLMREYYNPSGAGKVISTGIALLLLGQLTIWHSTTPLMLPLALLATAFTPLGVKLVNRKAGSWRPNGTFLRFALLAGIVYVAYHVLAGDRIYQVVSSTLYRLVVREDSAANVVPQRLFQITPLDMLRVALVIQGRDGIMVALLGLGALIIWRNRVRWANLLNFYVFLLLIAVEYLLMIGGAVTGLDYDRFLMVPVAISPFFAGVAVWWLYQKLMLRPGRLRWLRRSVWVGGVIALILMWGMEYYVYQPLIPKAKSLRADVQSEYVVWLHAVNTAYQERMLTFAEQYTDPNTRFATDLTSQRQFWRYFGLDAGIRRGLVLPLHWQVALDDRIKFYLLHWPGPSGPLGEQVEDRSAAKITELRDTQGWSLVYDNGQSFIMKIR